MQSQKNLPNPDNIMKIGSGFWASKILLSAVKFEIFTVLAEKKVMSAQEIKHEFGFKCSIRHVYDYLDTLTALGLLDREGLLETAKYSNNKDTDVFLDKNKPSYIGGILNMLNNRLYGFWGNLENALLTGTPQNEVKSGEDPFEAIYSDPNRLKEFIDAMSGIQMGNFVAFGQNFDFSTSNTLLDVGGSAGLLSIMVAKFQAHMNCLTYDLPPVQPIARDTILQFEMQERVEAISGDFFKDQFPKADIVVMGNILHDWDEETKLMLMKKAYDALPEGGAFVAIENVIDNERSENVFGLMMSINMLIETGNGFDYTFDDFVKWSKLIGFTSNTLIPLAGPTSAAIAYK